MKLIDKSQIVYMWQEFKDGTFSDGVTLQSIIDKIPVIEVKTADDVISKEQALRALIGFERYTGIDEAPYEFAENIVRDLPSIKPVVGHWIRKSRYGIDTCKCSVCGRGSWEMEFDYCANCGAKMESKT